MQFALLIYESPAALAARMNDDPDPYIGAWRAYYKALIDANVYVSGDALEVPESDMSHLMFYTPRVDEAALGANAHGSPVLMGRRTIPGTPQPVTEFYVAVPTWSDGTPANGHDST